MLEQQFPSPNPLSQQPPEGRLAGPVDVGAGDPELSRMKAEIEAVRAEKERVLHFASFRREGTGVE